MVQTAERNGELVADLAPERESLGETHVVRLGGLAPANEAGSGSDVLEVLLVANAPRFPECKEALVDAVGGAFLRIRSTASLEFARSVPVLLMPSDSGGSGSGVFS
jgi:hypothetical protein